MLTEPASIVYQIVFHFVEPNLHFRTHLVYLIFKKILHTSITNTIRLPFQGNSYLKHINEWFNLTSKFGRCQYHG